MRNNIKAADENSNLHIDLTESREIGRRKKKIFFSLAGGMLGMLLGISGKNTVPVIIVLSVFAAITGVFVPDITDKVKKSREAKMYDIDMADYLTNVSMLLASGLTLWDAMRRSIEGADIRRPLYRELNKAFERMDKGIVTDPVTAFEQMAAEINAPTVSMLSGIVSQNYRKGSGEVAVLMQDYAVTSRANRRNVCIKLADEATTLLLIPSTLILTALIVLLVAPAILTLASI